MTTIASVRAAEPSLLPGLLDDRSLCFEADPVASFLVAADGTLKTANDAGRALLSSGLLLLDPRNRVCAGLQSSRGSAKTRFEPLRPTPELQLRQITPAHWLIIVARRLPGLHDTFYMRAREIALDGEMDMSAVAGEFGLTESEKPVLQGLAQAVCPKEISRSLGLSIHTIRSHLRSIYAKLGVRTAAEAQNKALKVYYVMHLAS